MKHFIYLLSLIIKQNKIEIKNKIEKQRNIYIINFSKTFFKLCIIEYLTLNNAMGIALPTNH